MFLQPSDYNLLKILFLFEVIRGGAGYSKASMIGYWLGKSMSTTYRYLSRLTKGGYLNESTIETARGDVRCWSITALGRKKVIYNWPYLADVSMYPERLED